MATVIDRLWQMQEGDSQRWRGLEVAGRCPLGRGSLSAKASRPETSHGAPRERGTVSCTRGGVWGWHQLPVHSDGKSPGHSYGKLAQMPMRRADWGQENPAAICPTAPSPVLSLYTHPRGYRAYWLICNFLNTSQELVNKAVCFRVCPSALLQPFLLGAQAHYIPKAYVPDDCSFSFQ